MTKHTTSTCGSDAANAKFADYKENANKETDTEAITMMMKNPSTEEQENKATMAERKGRMAQEHKAQARRQKKKRRATRYENNRQRNGKE